MRFTAVKLGDHRSPCAGLEKLPKFRVRVASRVQQNDEMVVDGEAEILAPRKAPDRRTDWLRRCYRLRTSL